MKHENHVWVTALFVFIVLLYGLMRKYWVDFKNYSDCQLFFLFSIIYTAIEIHLPESAIFVADLYTYIEEALKIKSLVSPDTYWPLGYSGFLIPLIEPGATMTSVDLSSSVDVNRKVLRGLIDFRQVAFIQAMIFQLGVLFLTKTIVNKMHKDISQKKKLVFSAIFYTFFLFYVTSYSMPMTLSIDSIYGPLVCISLYLFYRFIDIQNKSNLVMFAISIAILYWIRNTILVIIGGWFLFYIFTNFNKKGFKNSAYIFCIFSMLSLLPLGLLNYKISDSFYPSNYNGWINIALGNHPGAGAYVNPKNDPLNWDYYSFALSPTEMNEFYGNDVNGMSNIDFHHRMKNITLPWMFNHPLDVAIFSLKKLYNLAISKNELKRQTYYDNFKFPFIFFNDIKYFCIAMVLLPLFWKNKFSNYYPAVIVVLMHMLVFSLTLGQARYRMSFEMIWVGLSLSIFLKLIIISSQISRDKLNQIRLKYIKQKG